MASDQGIRLNERVNMRDTVDSTGELKILLEKYYQCGADGQRSVLADFRAESDADVFPVLEAALRDDSNASLRNAGMEIYVALGARSLPRLIQLLKDSNEEVRTFSAVMIGAMNSRDAVPDLVMALSDPDMNVKHAAAEALGRIRDERAVLPLIDALSSDMWLQFPAAMALGDLGDSRAVMPLVALLEMPGSNMPAIQALGKIGDPAALAPLCGLLEDEDASLREWTLEAIASIFTRWPDSGAVLALTPKKIVMLIEMLGSAGPEFRRNAVITLGCCKIKEALPVLSEMTTDHDIGDVARKAIARIGRK